MGKITLILGGARSGKSRYAIGLAKKASGRVAFIATARGLDEEMKRRIWVHRKRRPSHWKTVEETKDLAAAVTKLRGRCDFAIIDCLTLFISNLMLDGRPDRYVEKSIDKMVKTLKRAPFDCAVVSNEVGLGIVPENPIARRFRDLAGRVNQMTAEAADDVYFMTAALPLKIKGE
jgi:adenosylcobinamide kinase/adenosylcobinamide-phosphate guanylyltransferase